MLVATNMFRVSSVGLKTSTARLALAAAILAGGCSADVARFDNPSYGLTDKGSAPLPPAAMRSDPAPAAGGDGASSGAYFPPPSGRTPSVRSSALPEPAPSNTVPAARPQQIAAAPASVPIARQAAPAPLAPAPSRSAAAAGGETIEVQQGDTLYAIARRHGTTVPDLMSANGLTGPSLKPGQKLALPSGSSRVAAMTRKPLARSEPAKPVPAVAGAVATAPAAAVASAAAAATPVPTDWTGTYTVKAGDSPYAIARQHKVSLNDLQRVNGIADPRKVMPGAVLKVPSSGGAPLASTPAVAAPAAAPIQPVKLAAAPAAPATVASDAPRVVQTKPVLINSQPQKVAALGDSARVATDAAPAAAAATPEKVAAVTPAPSALPAGKFRWPVKGKVISSFGPRSDGSHNDGVNITVPLGTEVHAAEQGVVAYAGSELKGYGNLVLIRHDNGWVTAYAHNDELLVKRGDKVKRGQVVGKAGKTGTVDQPQVHFELRQGSKPVDPLPHMEKL
jgi:murein DD-endopeptidase MepM/ murein hydrolase activator NlpD